MSAHIHTAQQHVPMKAASDADHAIYKGMAQNYLAPQPAIPAGWKLVPTEPTEEMSTCIELSMANSNNDIYRAMLAAAPEPSK